MFCCCSDDEAQQHSALKVTLALLAQLTLNDLQVVMPAVQLLATSRSVNCRSLVYDIARHVRHNLPLVTFIATRCRTFFNPKLCGVSHRNIRVLFKCRRDNTDEVVKKVRDIVTACLIRGLSDADEKLRYIITTLNLYL
jgi:hypothetical protein